MRAAIYGEKKWYARGNADDLAMLAEWVGRKARKIGHDLLELDFGNVVGLYPLREGVLEVRSGKWSVEDFDAALEDLFRLAVDLPFHAGQPSPLPVARDANAQNDVLYRTFLYPREALRPEAPRSLAAALHALASDPHRRFERHEVTVPVSRLRDVRFERLPVYLASARRWVTTAGLESLGIDGAVPVDLPEPRVRDTFDTAENRFVRAFVDHAIFVIDDTVRAVGTRACAKRVREDALVMHAHLEAARRTAPLCDAGRMAQAPMGSSVLQRRRGYRDVLRHFVRMRHAVKGLPFSSQAFDALLEGRDIAYLYELWAFFRVVEGVRAILGSPTAMDSPERTDLGVVVEHFSVAWGDDVTVAYQQKFTAAQRTSYSLSYKPDVALRVRGTLHLFDAKFRIRSSSGGRRPFREEDLAKMHAYRDAIREARSAWILYPGTRSVFYDAEAGPQPGAPGVNAAGVGAISPRPGDSERSNLGRALRGLLGASPCDWYEAETQRGDS